MFPPIAEFKAHNNIAIMIAGIIPLTELDEQLDCAPPNQLMKPLPMETGSSIINNQKLQLHLKLLVAIDKIFL